MRYTEPEKIDIFSIFVQNNRNKYAARRQYMEMYPNRQTPSLNTFVNIHRHVSNTHSFTRKMRTVRVNDDEDLNVLLYFEGNNQHLYQLINKNLNLLL